MKKLTLSVLLNLLIVTAASAESGGMKLSLKEAVRLALEGNLDLKAELYNPAQAEADIRKNRAIYATHLTLDSGYQDSTVVATSRVSGNKVKAFTISPGAYRFLPTGGTVSLVYDNLYTETNSTFATYNSYWQSDVTLSLNQPLLKNFGRDASELNIRVAEIGKEGSLKRLKGKLLDTVAQVGTEYYLLDSYRQDLESKKISIELANKVLRDTEARVKAGVTPAMEILNARFGVSLREKDLIDAEKTVRDHIDLLRLLLHLEQVSDIVTTDSPDRVEVAVNEDDAVRRALADRPDLEALQSQLSTNELQMRVANGRTLPDLNLVTSIATTGLSDRYTRTVEQEASSNYPVWKIGLKLDYPLGNQAAENDYIKSRLVFDQTKTQIESMKSAIVNEVRTSIRAVQSNFKQMDVADRALAYADERFKAYLKKVEVGLATNKDLLDVENDLAAARSSQIKAQVAYATARIQFWKSTGELLEREGIKIDASRADALYKEVK